MTQEKNKKLLSQFNELLKKFSERFKDLKIEDIQLDEIIVESQKNEQLQKKLDELLKHKLTLQNELVKIISQSENIRIAPPINKLNNKLFEWIIISNDKIFILKDNKH